MIEYANSRQPGGVGAVIVGGHVYRGSDVPHLQGLYVFGDWSASFAEPDGTLLVAKPGGAGLWPIREMAVEGAAEGRLGHYVLGFGQDADGEVYVLSSDRASPAGDTGRVYRLTAADPGVGQACPPGEGDTAEFTDRDAIPAVHRDAIDCASSHDIVAGFADGSFGPTLAVRRDQMATFIARTLDTAGVDLPAPATDRFTDVALGSTHDQAIHRLAAAGIVQGGPEGLPATSYGPDRQVRRDQMASFLIRAAELATDQQLASQDRAFADVPPANSHFANVNAAAEAGLAQGFSDGTYRPASTVRRDQMTTFVIRLLAHLVGE